MMGLLSVMLQITSGLAQTGSFDLSMPRMSDWKIRSYNENTIGVDVADLFSLGAGAIVPINVNVGGGVVDLELYKPSANLKFKISGTGMKVGVGAGWNLIPGLTGGGSGAKVLAKLLNSTAGKLQDINGGDLSNAAGLPNGGIGTLLAGPKASSALSPAELEGFLTFITGNTDFGVNGVGMGLVIFGKEPITDPSDLVLACAIGLVGDVHFTLGKVEAGINYASFKCKVDMASMPDGGYQGMSVAP